MTRSSAFIGAAVVGAALFAAAPFSAHAGFTVFEANALAPAGIQATVDSYRLALGTLNPNVAGSLGSGRREINWDGVPAGFTDSNLLPGNFFNSNSPRGVQFTTPGTGFLVSANAGGVTPVAFGFPGDFTPFSAQKMFSPIGSTITDISFFVPGSSAAATVAGFGAVFEDVEFAASTRMEAFDVNGVSLFSRNVLFSQTSGTLSFLGILANAGERIARIRLVTGDGVLLSNGVYGAGADGVVMDDFIYAEPIGIAAVVPVPASALLLGSGLFSMLGLGWKRRRMAKRSSRD